MPVNNNGYATGSLASSAVTADQQILTYTVPAGKIFQLAILELSAMLTTYAATATWFGTASFRVNGVKVMTFNLFGAGNSQTIMLETPVVLSYATGDVLTVVCTPSAATAFTWEANLGGTLL